MARSGEQLTESPLAGPDWETAMGAHPWDDILQPDDRLAARSTRAAHRVGTAPAVLMIDLYARVFGDRPEPLAAAIERFPSSCGMSAWNALGPLRRLLAVGREHAAVAHTTGESRPEADLGGATRGARDPRDLPPAQGYEIVESLRPQAGELVVYKSRASAFFGTPLDTALRLRGIDTLVIAGESTSGCVRATVVDAYSLGFHVVVVEEATFDRSPTSHKVNLFDMHHKYATVAPLEAVERYLRSGDPSGIEAGAVDDS